MKIDLHVHLEEGPYSLHWLNRTAESLIPFAGIEKPRHSRDWLEDVFFQLSERIKMGAYSRNWLDHYLCKAKQVGLREVGIVEHLYRFREYKSYFETYIHMGDDPLGELQRRWLDQVCVVSVEEFVTFVRGEQERWADAGVDLKLGVELDFFPGGEAVLAQVGEQHPWDYVIGAVHFLKGWGFDNPDTKERFSEIDLLSLYSRLFDVVEKAIASGLFDIIAHLDNLKVFGYRPSETALLAYYQRIAKLLKRHDVATEINTGLYYRYPVKEMCPSFRFLEVLSQHHVPVTTSSDSHFPDHLDNYLPEAREQLKKAGFSHIVTFQQRHRKEIALI